MADLPSRPAPSGQPFPKMFLDAMRQVTTIARAEDDRMDIDPDFPPPVRPARPERQPQTQPQQPRQPLPTRPSPAIHSHTRKPSHPDVPPDLKAKYMSQIKHLEAKLVSAWQRVHQLDLKNKRLAVRNSMLEMMLRKERESRL